MRYFGPRVVDYGPCPYLPDRRWHALAMSVQEMSPEEFGVLLSRGYRRSYSEMYTPLCPTCRECWSMRIPVADFKPSKTQRKVWKANQDLVVTVEEPSFSQEKMDLYNQFQQERWGKAPVRRQVYDMLKVFHFGNTREFQYRLDGELLGFGLVDTAPQAASSVYFSWKGDPARRLGTFSMLWEIDWCRRTGRDHLYMGLYVRGCKAMNYKASFRPHEIMERGQEWRVPSPGETPSQGGTGPVNLEDQDLE